MAKTITTNPATKPSQRNFPRRRTLPKWRQAEEYFRVYRDTKLKISLPRLKCLEPPDAR